MAAAGMPAASTPAPAAKFLKGDLMRHIVVMSSSASIGLLSIFLVDFVDLYFISLLGEAALTAAVGFAGTLLFFTMSLTIGLMIAMSALASRRIGADNTVGARQIATSVMVLGFISSVVFSILFWIFTPNLLDLVGASGATKDYATTYLRIVVPSVPFMAIAMVSTGLLRAHGDARRAMNATLSAGIVNAVLDPILIFGLAMGLEGAAWASVAARIAMAITAITPVIRRYGGFAAINRERFQSHLRPIMAIAGPAILTNLATPTGTVLVTRAIAPYGDGAVAGYAVLARLMPLVFVVIFALSGAVGPIIGQNFGAGAHARVRETVLKSVIFTSIYVLCMWLVLFITNGFIADQFNLDATGRAMVFWFSVAGAPLLFFNGILYITNAGFNNLDHPLWSTLLNWGRNTLGIAPFIWLGAKWGGAPGVVIGQYAGAIIFAALGMWMIHRLIGRYESAAVSTNIAASEKGPDKGPIKG